MMIHKARLTFAVSTETEGGGEREGGRGVGDVGTKWACVYIKYTFIYNKQVEERAVSGKVAEAAGVKSLT